MTDRRHGIALMALSVLANPRTVGLTVSPDGRVESGTSLALIVVLEILSFAAGLTILLRPGWWVRLTATGLVRGLSVRSRSLYYSVYFGSAVLALSLAGGAFVLWREQTPTAFLVPMSRPLSAAALAMILGYLAWSTALILARADLKKFWFSNILFGTLLVVSLYATNLAVSFLIPSWPARGLHGIDPEAGREMWAKAAVGPESVANNSWGQRDRERMPVPGPGVRRVVFIGDSFLEEGTTVPLSVQVEEKRAQVDLEVINLGVSATAPDEYYYRLKNIALPMEPDHCLLFFYSNDFVQSETLPSYLGVIAPQPRGSVLELLGLGSLNHVLANRQRPVLRHWGNAGELWERHRRWFTTIDEASDEDMADALASMVSEHEADNLLRVLADRDLREFTDMLRNPDKDVFRIYYVEYALSAAASGVRNREPLSTDYAYHWVKRCHDLCVSKGIRFTLVVIPTSFQVDPRVQDQFRAIADMKEQTRPFQDAADELVRRVRADGMEYLDLGRVLAGEPGTYLNLDGHWSDHGADVASSAVAEYLETGWASAALR
jgi:hypothetical protein